MYWNISVVDMNPQKCLDITLHYCQNPLKLWEYASIGQRTIFQNLIYPSGISYNHKNDSFRIPDADTMFVPVAYKLGVLGERRKGERASLLVRDLECASQFMVRTKN